MESGQERRKIHEYLLFWIGVIVLIGVLVFIAYALASQDDPESQVNVLPATPTLPPTVTIEPSATVIDTFPLMPATETIAAPFTPTPLPVQDRQFDLGIHVQATRPAASTEVLQGYLEAVATQLNLNWIKADLRWDVIEGEAGTYQWDVWDSFFAEAAQYGLKVLVNVSGTPSWARPANFGDPGSLVPPREPAQFAEFVTTLLRRYPNQIHAVEIWQGMNLRQNWDSPAGLTGDDYMALVATTGTAIRAVDPNIIVMSGGLTPTGLNDQTTSVDNFAYMDMLIAAGLLDVVDCVGVHHSGYNIAPTVSWEEVPPDEAAQFRGPFDNPHPSFSFYSTMTTYANKIAVAGSDKPLCVTEFGWAVADDLSGYPPDFSFALDNTLVEQGAWIAAAIEQMDTWDFVWLAFLWNMNNGPEEAFNPYSAGVVYSLIRPDYVLSPAWQAIAEFDFRRRPH